MLGLPAPYRTPWQYALHSNRSYTLSGGSRLAAGSSIFTILHFLPRTIAYAAEQLHQQTSGRSHPHNGVGIRIRSSTLPRTIAYAVEQLHQQDVWQIASAYYGWLNTDQEKDGRRWPPGYEPGAIRIVRDHLPRRLVYLHTISSAAVQLCPDGDPKVIRLLSEGFWQESRGIVRDQARNTLGQPRMTAPQRVHQLKAWKVE
jgi:hypothetical protein